MTGIGDITIRTQHGEEKLLGDYAGKALLIVNVASRCGHTPQYAGLEALNRAYRERGLRVLGFPSNDFGGQEPGTNEEIAEFCQVNYGVTFDMFEKVHALGPEQHPLYARLTSAAEPAGDVGWNFEKFLIGKDGAIIGRFMPAVKPDDPTLVGAIENALR